ncbi:MAG: SUMF1/EgtB/PvdO family nonheme iron enzyme [Candidatus Competibacter sp.]|nr:SUMF1/EgtB/PvdO family nonheme iron enzyme [Candidatus Competibacter sp.]
MTRHGLLLVLLAGFSMANAAERFALVIGNSKYAERPLTNPSNDARAMAALLQKLGFTVTKEPDLNLKNFRSQINDFLDQSKDADVRLFYYSGHGANYGDDNYLLPIGHGITREHELPDQAYSVKTLLRGLKKLPGISLVLLDSCRDAPFSGDSKSLWDDSKGMKPLQPNQAGVLIGYAADQGQTASDNSMGANSLYTKHLLEQLSQRKGLREILAQVRQGVYAESDNKQFPMTEDRLLGDVYLAGTGSTSPPPGPVPPPTPPAPPPAVDHDLIAWQSAEKCGTAACFQAYLDDYPSGRYARMAKARLKPEPPPRPPAPVERPRQSFEPELVSISGGCFQMGSPMNEPERGSNAKQHQVCVENFAIGKTEVTQGQWQAVMGSNPSSFENCADCPVEHVSWNDVRNYLDKLNQRTGQRYRLPTEAEWEYACRGGREGQRYCGGDDIDRLAWHGDNSGAKTHPVGRKAANGFGLYDMSGNVWEWTCSAYDQDYGGAEQRCAEKGTTGPLAVRGGAWYNVPDRVRSATRRGDVPTDRNDGLGFRLARSF